MMGLLWEEDSLTKGALLLGLSKAPDQPYPTHPILNALRQHQMRRCQMRCAINFQFHPTLLPYILRLVGTEDNVMGREMLCQGPRTTTYDGIIYMRRHNLMVQGNDDNGVYHDAMRG